MSTTPDGPQPASPATDPYSAHGPFKRAQLHLHDVLAILDGLKGDAIAERLASRVKFAQDALSEVSAEWLATTQLVRDQRFTEVVVDGRRLEWNGAPVIVEAENERRALTALAFWMTRDDATRASMLYAVLHTTLPRRLSRPPLNLWHETLSEF